MTAAVPVEPELMRILRRYHWQQDLEHILQENNLNLKTLRQYKMSRVDALCRELNLSELQSGKMRALIKEIRKLDRSNIIEEKRDEDMDLRDLLNFNQLPPDLYDALISEGITFDDLEEMEKDHVNKLCEEYDITLKVNLRFQKVLKRHQREINRQEMEREESFHSMSFSLQERNLEPNVQRMKIIIIGCIIMGTFKWEIFIFFFPVNIYLITHYPV